MRGRSKRGVFEGFEEKVEKGGFWRFLKVYENDDVVSGSEE
jgi:hypothetical protein